MLHLARKVYGATIRATDGDIGTVEDFYFDEDSWTVRYLLVDTGRWFSGKKVLVSPMSVSGPWGVTGIHVTMTKDRVWNSPQFDRTQPLSEETETIVVGYYGYPDYWGADNVWGTYENPAALLTAPPAGERLVVSERTAQRTRHLRSTKESTGYHVRAADGEIGHVDDFLIGEESWRIRYLLLDTSNWIGGRSVIVAPAVVQSVDREKSLIHVSTTRAAIKDGPAYDTIEASLDTAETGPPFTII